MNLELITALLLSLALTLVFETGFFFLVGKRDKKDLLLVGAVNIVTNPVVVLLYWLTVFYTDANPFVVIAFLELLAVCIEGRYYSNYGHGFDRPYLFSAAANGFSFSIGVLLQKIV